MNKKQHEKEMLENELVTWTEKNFGHLKPYLPMIGMVVGLIVLVVIVAVFYFDVKRDNDAIPWRLLGTSINNARVTGETRQLTMVADEFPDNTAGLWGLQLAADYELRTGINDFVKDETGRKEGLDKVKRAKDFYQRIVDSSLDKSTMLQRRSLYGLAYASETLGEFDAAREHYQKLVDEGGDSPFLEIAQRGLDRTSNDVYASLYKQFAEWEDVAGDAPGPVLPQRPQIDFPGSEAGQTGSSGGGDFDTGEQANAAKTIPASSIVPSEAFDPKYDPKDSTETTGGSDDQDDQDEDSSDKDESDD